MAEGKEKSEVAKREEAILAFWKERDIFKKSVDRPAANGEFVFYEGPPTANGRPGIHHLESRAFKDAIPRYRTMAGYHVRRKAGWDTHGLPVELEVEKKIGSKTKKDIEAFGVAEFNKKCKESVLQYIDEWKQFTERIAYWVDHDDTYFTFDNSYIESIWHIVKHVHGRGLLYKDYKVVPWCPRCGTGLSSHEVAQGYADVKDPAVYVKFKLKDEDAYIVAWTTTPWTLPGNVGLAVGEAIAYQKVQTDGGALWVAKDRVAAVAPGARVLEEAKGSALVGKSYEPLYPFLADAKLPESERAKMDAAYKVYAADFVSTEDGTGIVHTAVMYGAEDFELGTKVGLPKYHLVNEDGTYSDDAGAFAGLFVKKADALITEDLKTRGLLLKEEIVEHTYPFCWRCKTPLIYFARDSWYIAMSKIKDDLIRENETIHWEPEHIRDGRFGEWLRDLKDWAISRSRYWGTPLPIWECVECKQFEVIGSIAELKEKTGAVPDDLHRPYIDDSAFTCFHCSGTMRRVPEVMDVWFDSGAMPFAQDHYPFENKAWVEGSGYPADYICEAIDQTRGWFYTLHAIGSLMERGKAFKNVICLGHILDAKGKKMSKSLGNIVVPQTVIDTYGVDALRYFMFTVNAPGDSKNFDERIVDEIVKKNLGRLGNVLSFYALYADGTPRDFRSTHILDRWIIARLAALVSEVTEGFERYELDAAARPLALFIDDLSAWYVRRSRDRFKEEGEDKQMALATLRYVLYTFAKLMAPVMPFFAEHLFQAVREEEDEESVHLSLWPEPLAHDTDAAFLLTRMFAARIIVSQALKEREVQKLNVRQPLAKLTIGSTDVFGKDTPGIEEYLELIKDEVNVKAVAFSDTPGVMLDTTVTEDLLQEGLVREVKRLLQGARKDAALQPNDVAPKATLTAHADEVNILQKHLVELQKATRIERIELVEGDKKRAEIA